MNTATDNVTDTAMNNHTNKKHDHTHKPPNSRMSVDSIFDPVVSDEVNPSQFIPLPQINDQKRDIQLNEHLESYQQQRKELNTIPEETQLEIEEPLDKELTETEQNQMYEHMLRARGITTQNNLSTTSGCMFVSD